MTVLCLSCHRPFSDYKELAVHISASRRGHQKGKKWAAKYLLLHGKRDQPERRPLTDKEKESKASLGRQVSGQEQTVLTMCPRCKKGFRQALPVEYVRSQEAWQKNKCLMMLCEGCRK